MLKSGCDGYTMFKDNKILKGEVLIDNQMLINYIVDVLGGRVGEDYKNPLGNGRIKAISEALKSDNPDNPGTGDVRTTVKGAFFRLSIES